jgi:hypothetical protein
MTKKYEIPVINQMIFEHQKQPVMICIAWNGILPKNLPQWIKDVKKDTMWQEIEISGIQLLELFNSGIDVLMSRTSGGKILIGLNEQGKKFGQC